MVGIPKPSLMDLVSMVPFMVIPTGSISLHLWTTRVRHLSDKRSEKDGGTSHGACGTIYLLKLMVSDLYKWTGTQSYKSTGARIGSVRLVVVGV